MKMTKIDLGKINVMMKDQAFRTTDPIFLKNGFSSENIRYFYKKGDMYNVTIDTLERLLPALAKYEEEFGNIPETTDIIDTDYLDYLFTEQPITSYFFKKVSKETEGKILTLSCTQKYFNGTSELQRMRGLTAMRYIEVAKMVEG